MTPTRLLELWNQPNLISDKESEILESLTRDFPYFNLPYIILSKVYKDNEDYRYDDMMRHAAIRCKNRKDFYEYLHQSDLNLISKKPQDDVKVIEKIITQEKKDSVESTEVVKKSAPEPIQTEVKSQVPEIPVSSIPKKVKSTLSEKINKPEKIADNKIKKLQDLEKVEIKESTEKTKISKVKLKSVNEEVKISENKPKKKNSEVHTFEEWLNEFSHFKTQKPDSGLNAGLEYVKRKKTVFKPEKKSNAPEAIALIEDFIEKSPSISKTRAEFFKAETAAKKSLEMDFSIATETLATLYVKQGHIDQAKEVYQKLMLKFPEKERYFAALIEKLNLNNE